MKNQWIPESATHFFVQRKREKVIEIEFSNSSHGMIPPHFKRIDELHKELAISDVCQQISAKPLEDRIVATGAVTADEILQRGADHIRDRAATRDKPGGERTMSQVVKAFNAIFGTKLTEEQGWQFMVLLKIVRGANGKVSLDDYEDEAAYAALAAEAAMKERA
jgi:hypothetical protein